MDFDAGASAPAAPDFTPAAPVEAPEPPQAPAEVEAPQAPEPAAPKDTFAARDEQRIAGARDPNDGMDTGANSGKSLWEKINNGELPGIQPALYQGPGIFTPVPREATHVGITQDEGLAAGINRNFVNYTAAANANVDAREYDNDAAHAYNFSRDATLQRAGDLGSRLEDQTTRYLGAKNDAQRMDASRAMATTYGQYLHTLQDNRAHGGTDRAEHYGDHVDENPDNARMARQDTRAAMADFRTYLQSRGIDPMRINPGPTPPYSWPPVSAVPDKYLAPTWDHQSRMWNRDEMSRGIQDTFNGRLRLGTNPVAQ